MTDAGDAGLPRVVAGDGPTAPSDLEGRRLAVALGWLAERGLPSRVIWTGTGTETGTAAFSDARVIAVRPLPERIGWELVAARFPEAHLVRADPGGRCP